MRKPLEPDPEEPERDTWFYRVLIWRVHDPDEALHIAITHRRLAAEARAATPASLDTFHEKCRARLFESRAWNHDQIVEVCGRHEARLRAAIAAEMLADAVRVPRCTICQRPLDQPGDPTTAGCGGDCLRCMAEIGNDPDCKATMERLTADR